MGPGDSVTDETVVSLRAFAKRKGVSLMAVCRAVKTGRLNQCLVYVAGVPKIGDQRVADLEWESNVGRPAPAKRATTKGAKVVHVRTLLEAQRVSALERARKL